MKITSVLFKDLNDVKEFIKEKFQIDVLYLYYDEWCFEEIVKLRNVNREISTQINSLWKKSEGSAMKNVTFNCDKDIKTIPLFNFIQKLRKNFSIVATIYNRKIKECSIIFVGKKDDTLLEDMVCDFLLERVGE